MILLENRTKKGKKKKGIVVVIFLEGAYISPHCDITIGILGLLFGPVGTFSILRSTSKPSATRPTKGRQRK